MRGEDRREKVIRGKKKEENRGDEGWKRMEEEKMGESKPPGWKLFSRIINRTVQIYPGQTFSSFVYFHFFPLVSGV